MLHLQIRDKSPPTLLFYSFIKNQKKPMTKISILVLSMLFINLWANCQITKGYWMVGGSASYSSTNYKSDFGSKNKVFDLQLTPQIGYFIADKLATGIAADIVYSGFRIDESTKSTTTDFNLGAFCKIFFTINRKGI
jgi:hypothetical protein